MKAILIGAVATASLVLPFAAFAATYQYVNVQGNLESETAANPELALTQPTDIAPHSGVMLVTATPVTGTTSVTAPVNTSSDTTYTDVLTGVNTAPRTLYLTLGADGTVVLSSLYTGSTPMMIETGTWTGTGNNQITVTLTGNQSGTYSQPQTIVFTQDGGTLTATNYNTSVYGTQGLTFTQ